MAPTACRLPAFTGHHEIRKAFAPEVEKQLKTFIDKFEPGHQKFIRAVRRALRKRFPTAYELAYDNYNFFVIGYSPTERPSGAVVSMAAGANGVGLCFIQGASLPDPKKVLMGQGTRLASFVSSPQIHWRAPRSRPWSPRRSPRRGRRLRRPDADR